jgi:hypothetical protein
MLVTDYQIAALRAYLTGVFDDDGQLQQQLIQSGEVDGLGKLVYATFVTAVRQRFSPTYMRADIISFVASARALLSERSDMIDPRTGENLIRRALGEAVSDESDQQAASRTQLTLLVALIKREQFGDSELDDFLIQVRILANRWWPN